MELSRTDTSWRREPGSAHEPIRKGGQKMQFRVRTLDSMPERLEVTNKIEEMKKQQAKDDKEVAAQSAAEPFRIDSSNPGGHP